MSQRKRISVVSVLLGALILLVAAMLFYSQALKYYYDWQLRLNRKDVLRALVELGEAEKAEDWCIDTLESEDVSERKLAAEFLGELRSVRAIPYLIDRFSKSEICIGELQHEHLELKVESDYLGTALASIGEPAIPLLIDMMGADGDHWRASGVLGRIGPPAIPHLLRALENGNHSARVGAASALAKIGPRAQIAVPLLINSLRNKDNRQRQFFAVALGGIGPEAESAVPALLDPGRS